MTRLEQIDEEIRKLRKEAEGLTSDELMKSHVPFLKTLVGTCLMQKADGGTYYRKLVDYSFSEKSLSFSFHLHALTVKKGYVVQSVFHDSVYLNEHWIGKHPYENWKECSPAEFNTALAKANDIAAVVEGNKREWLKYHDETDL